MGPCSLAACFAELPSTHTHANAIALPQPSPPPLAAAVLPTALPATAAVAGAAAGASGPRLDGARPDGAQAVPGRPSLMTLPTDVLRLVLQVGRLPRPKLSQQPDFILLRDAEVL